MRKDDLIRVNHMLEAGRKALSFAAGRTRSDLAQDDMLTFALIKAIEIIGEAAAKVSTDTKERLNTIPWTRIVGMRIRLIHAYHDVNPDILWNTVTDNLPPLLKALESIVASESTE